MSVQSELKKFNDKIRADFVTKKEPGRPPRVVGVESGSVMAVSYHPELTGDATLHRLLLA